MTIKTLQEIIVDLQSVDNISVILCDHQARDLLACVDTAAIIHNGKVVAQGTPTSLIQNICVSIAECSVESWNRCETLARVEITHVWDVGCVRSVGDGTK